MKALSLRQPWAWAVAHGGKRLENRIWPYLAKGLGNLPTGRIAIHASKTKPTDGDIAGVTAAMRAGQADPTMPYEIDAEALTPSVIVATCRIVGVMRYDVAAHAKEIDAHLDTGNVEWPRYPLRSDDREHLETLFGAKHAADQVARWWLGPYALVLGDVVALLDRERPVVSGRQLFWQLPYATLDAIPRSLQ